MERADIPLGSSKPATLGHAPLSLEPPASALGPIMHANANSDSGVPPATPTMASAATPVSKSAPSQATTLQNREKRALFGEHLMLDMKLCQPHLLNDLEHCFKLLDQLPDHIGMKKISAPHVFRYQSPLPKESGITGVTLIAESHISLHTFPEKGYAFADIFSCKPFDTETVVQLFQEHFRCVECDVFRQPRGRDFSESSQTEPIKKSAGQTSTSLAETSSSLAMNA